jgi:hypothetical protein
VEELLQVEHFEPHVGKLVRFKGTRFAFPLEQIISEKQRFPGSQRLAFSLIFRGPREREYLPEGLYACEIEGGPTYELYVAPIHTPEQDRQNYQAVFN